MTPLAGRKSIYSPELLAKAQEYASGNWRAANQIPSIEGLALFLGIAKSTAYKWRDEAGKEEFSDVLDQILTTQEVELFDRGLIGEFNATMAKLRLTKHGYSDKSQNELSGPGGKPIEIDNSTTIQVVGMDD